MEDKSRRKFYRTDFKVKGSFHSGNNGYDLILNNLSLKGALATLTLDVSLPPETSGILEIFLTNSNIVIKIENATLLRHTENNELAFVFREIDAESMIHLRRLLELNSVYEGEIEKELDYLKPD